MNIAPLTLRKWLAAGEEGDERWAEFAATVREAEAEAECRAVVQIQLQGKDDWRALAWWLERRFPQAWGDQRTVNVKMTQERDVIFDAIAKAMTRRGHGDAIEDILAELAAGSGEEASSDPTAEDQRH